MSYTNRLKEILCAAVTTVCCWLFVATSVTWAQLPVTIDDRRISVPEVYLAAPTDHCVLKIEFYEDDAIIRKKIISSFITASFFYTNNWNGQFIVAGVDYVNFLSFFVVTFSACAKRAEIEKKLSEYFEVCPSQNRSNCNAGTITVVIESDSELVELYRQEVPIAKFERFRNSNELEKCTIKVKSRFGTIFPEERFEVNSIFLALYWKYRMLFIFCLLDFVDTSQRWWRK